MTFTFSLKEAIKYIWHIIITVIVHEYTHLVYIYLTNRQYIIGNKEWLTLCSIGRTCHNSNKVLLQYSNFFRLVGYVLPQTWLQ